MHVGRFGTKEFHSLIKQSGLPGIQVLNGCLNYDGENVPVATTWITSSKSKHQTPAAILYTWTFLGSVISVIKRAALGH